MTKLPGEVSFRLHLHRTIKATAEAAFRACSDAELLARWFTTRAQVDLQTGGKYSNADGDCGTYLSIEPPHLLSFTWENPRHCPGSIVTLTFRDVARGRMLIRLLHRDLKSADEVNHMRDGWQCALTNLKLFLEEGKTITFEDWQKLPRKRGGGSSDEHEALNGS